MKYDWIVFDADDTLFHFDAFNGLKLMFKQWNVEFSKQDYQTYQVINQPLWVAYQNGKIDADELRHQRFLTWAVTLNVTTEQLNLAFLDAMAKVCQLLPGAKELLNTLVGKARLGIITNGFTELQQARLENTGLTNIFDLIVVSDKVGAAKPQPAIFDYAYEQMNFPNKEKILMVGDNPHSDILGGLNAGWHTCWLNTHQMDRPNNIEPHYEVNSLFELKTALF